MKKPFKTYLGGKESSGVYQTIINNIPKHNTLIIPFLGNCAVFRHIAAAANTILIDADSRATEAWCTIFDNNDVISTSINIINGDAISYLQKYRGDPETFIYCDPPYPLETRSSKNTKYLFDFTNEDHSSLLLTLLQLDCRIAISTYANELYKRMLKGWNCLEFKSQCRSGQRLELLYMNYDISKLELHDYSYLGKDFRERERIKNKILRHSSRLMRMDRFEALAIMNQLTKDLITINDDSGSIIKKDDASAV